MHASQENAANLYREWLLFNHIAHDIDKYHQKLHICKLIEDLDLIAKTRDLFSNQEFALVSLLKAMDGIEAKEEIVTITTTNYLEILDKALKERPARFDRVISLSLPNFEQRQALIQLHCPPIPLADETRHYIARRTAGFTPAQIQEVIYSLVIEFPDCFNALDPVHLAREKAVVDRLICRISGTSKTPLGFQTQT